MSSQPPHSAGQPLFMVDHGFAKQSKSWTGNVRNRTLYGLGVSGEAASNSKKSRRRTRMSPLKAGSDVHDSASDITTSSHQAGDENRRRSSESMVRGRTSPGSRLPPPFVPSPDKDQLRRGSNVSGTPSALYGLNALDTIKGLECYMTYYLEVIGAGNYPMEMRLQIQDNPIRWSWFPLAFEDDLWLKNIIVTSAFHHADATQMPKPQGAEDLMQTFIAQLNDRISNQNFSDGTIGSVSCLATIEHASGNDEMADVHLRGMAEMIKARGGLSAISRERRTKIMRADVVRSADLLKVPLLPRPQRPFSPLDQTAHVDGNDFSRSFELLLKSGVTVNMSPICWNMKRTMQMIEAIWHSAQTMETMTYYEDIMCLNYDLLAFQPTTALERAYKIALLTFIQPLYRYYPFSGRLAQPRSTSLQAAMQHIAMGDLEFPVRLWLYAVGSIGSQQTRERDWFMDLFSQALQEQAKTGDCSWETIQVHLKQIAWTKAVHGPLGKSLFLDVTLDPTRFKPLSGVFAPT